MKEYLDFQPHEINPIHICNAIFISIVLYLHHASYTNDYLLVLLSSINELLQKFSVGGFLFFSGFKLAISYLETPSMKFIKKRLKRVYILYIVALILFSFTAYPFLNNESYPNINNFIIHALCLQTIVPDLFQHNYHTLWFVSILFCCYVYFLLSRRYIKENNGKKFLSQITIVCISLFIIHNLSLKLTVHLFSDDFIIYLSFFSAGVYFSHNSLKFMNMRQLSVVGIVTASMLALMVNVVAINTWYESVVFYALVITSNISLFLILLFLIKKYKLPKKIFTFISILSYSSFCMFLFHRPVWSIMASFYRKGDIIQWIYIVFIGGPFIILFSYYVQLFFDKIILYRSTVRHST